MISYIKAEGADGESAPVTKFRHQGIHLFVRPRAYCHVMLATKDLPRRIDREQNRVHSARCMRRDIGRGSSFVIKGTFCRELSETDPLNVVGRLQVVIRL